MFFFLRRFTRAASALSLCVVLSGSHRHLHRALLHLPARWWRHGIVEAGVSHRAACGWPWPCPFDSGPIGLIPAARSLLLGGGGPGPGPMAVAWVGPAMTKADRNKSFLPDSVEYRLQKLHCHRHRDLQGNYNAARWRVEGGGALGFPQQQTV